MTRPIRRRGAPPAGERLTRDKVITTATELIERAGGAAVSLRSLAKEPDVRPSRGRVLGAPPALANLPN